MFHLALINYAIQTYTSSPNMHHPTKQTTYKRKHKKEKIRFSKIHNTTSQKYTSPNRFTFRNKSQEKYNNNHTTGIVHVSR